MNNSDDHYVHLGLLAAIMGGHRRHIHVNRHAPQGLIAGDVVCATERQSFCVSRCSNDAYDCYAHTAPHKHSRRFRLQPLSFWVWGTLIFLIASTIWSRQWYSNPSLTHQIGKLLNGRFFQHLLHFFRLIIPFGILGKLFLGS